MKNLLKRLKKKIKSNLWGLAKYIFEEEVQDEVMAYYSKGYKEGLSDW